MFSDATDGPYEHAFCRRVIISRVRRFAPMLLTRAGEWPAGGDWALEPKWDGYRLVASVEDGRARCWTRHGTELTSRVGALADELVELLPNR